MKEYERCTKENPLYYDSQNVFISGDEYVYRHPDSTVLSDDSFWCPHCGLEWAGIEMVS